MTDDHLDELAEEYGAQAMADIGDPAEAAGVLMQAGLAVTLLHFSPDAASAAVSGIVKGLQADIATFVGVGETRQ